MGTGGGSRSSASAAHGSARRRGRRLGPPGADGEVAGEGGGELGRLRPGEGLRRRAALEAQARQPEDEIEERVAADGLVPVEEQAAPVTDAEVVAAGVEVPEAVAVERGARGGVGQRVGGGRATRARTA